MVSKISQARRKSVEDYGKCLLVSLENGTGKLDTCMPKNDIGPFSHIIYKNQLEINT
jgi:hypothetical protein